MNSVRLHRQFVQQMLDLGLRATAPQRENLAWLCQSLAYSPDCQLARWPCTSRCRGNGRV